LVLRQLKKYPLAELRVTRQEDGLVIGETVFSPQQLQDVRYWHNVLVVMAEAETTASLETLAQQLTPALLKRTLALYFPHAQTLQLRVIEGSQPASLSPVTQRRVEAVLSDQSLVLTSHHPDVELWLLRRTSGLGVIGLRLPRQRFKRQERAAGELRPELAHVLALAAGVTSKDIVLDSFAGHGAIPRELIAGFSPRQVIAIEQDPRLAGKLRSLAKEKKSLTVLAGDALAMDLADQSVTRIVTDPPWGDYAVTSLPLPQFYARMLTEFLRVLRPGGVAVILAGTKEVVETAAEKSAFEVVKVYEVLVSGKKAAIVKLRKPS